MEMGVSVFTGIHTDFIHAIFLLTMPHTRKRHLTALLSSSLNYSTAVGIFGHRQVGKTTLAEQLSARYLTLDDANQLNLATMSPKKFIEENKALPLAIDECQLAPPLFPAIKEFIRTHKSPGQLLLTGSVRFSSRKAIKESLTGRMIAWDLLPMDLSEAHQQPLPSSIIRLINTSNVNIPIQSAAYFKNREIDLYLKNGGLPGIFSLRNVGLKNQKFQTQLNTILERDLKLVFETTLSLRTLRNLLQVLALHQNEPLDLSKISRLSRVSVPTLRKLIAAFESIYLIRLIETEGTEKKPVLFFEDQGEASFSARTEPEPLKKLTLFLYANLRVQIYYRPEVEGELFQYRTRNGAYVPLCFRTNKGILGIIPTTDTEITHSDLGSAHSFLKKYPSSKIIFTHTGTEDRSLGSKMRLLPVAALFT